MKRVYGYIWIALLFMAGAPRLQGGQGQVEVSLDTTTIRIGEQTLFHITATVEPQQTLQWPVIADTLGRHIQVVRQEAADTVQTPNGLWQITRSWRITAFDSGYHVIPPMPFSFGQQSTQSEPLLLEVQTLPVDTSAPIKPIQEIWKVPLSLREVLPWILATLVLLAAAIVIYLYIKKRKKQPGQTPPQIPALPAHNEALTRLKELEKKQLWQNGQTNKYYIELTAIIRHYIERAFNVESEELTTSQTLDQLQGSIDDRALDQLERLLKLADLVKFARLRPAREENTQSATWARSFVEQTKPKPNDQLE